MVTSSSINAHISSTKDQIDNKKNIVKSLPKILIASIRRLELNQQGLGLT